MIPKLTGFIGLFVFIGVCCLLSKNRKAIKWKPVITGCLLQFLLALFILKTSLGVALFDKARILFEAFMNYGNTGAAFVFGPLADEPLLKGAFGAGNGFLFAVKVTAVIIFVSTLSATLYHLNLMQPVVHVFAKIMAKIMGTSGAESLASVANVLMGQTEAPLVVRPYLNRMTGSEIMAVMTGGMANVAGSVLAAYVSFGIDAGHLLAASVMSAPASLAIAKILVPETGVSETANTVPKITETIDSNVLDAACRGASEGLQLSLNVMAMLIAFIALIAFLNAGLTSIGPVLDWTIGLLGGTSTFFAGHPITLQGIFGLIGAPIAFFMGVEWKDCLDVGTLIGIKTSLNEFVGYVKLADMKDVLSPRSYALATYALCGFANFSSVAIQIEGIGALIPERRKDLAKYGLLSMIGGSFSTFMAASIAGLLM